MAILTNIFSIDATYLKTTDSFGNTVQTKIWGTLTRETTYANIDTAIRALCSLSRNSYDDTILQSNEVFRYDMNSGDAKTINQAKSLKFAIGGEYNNSVLNETMIWSGSLNPEVTFLQIKTAMGTVYVTGNNQPEFQVDQLYSLIDYPRYKTERNLNITGSQYLESTAIAEVSVNEQLA